MARKLKKSSLTAPVDNFVRVSNARMEAVWKEGTKRLIFYIQTPRAKGGRMRVDTGFLRASGQASLTGLPQGPVRPNEDKTYNIPDLTVVTIAQAKLGGKIWFGWTANYARIREYYDGFLRGGVSEWPRIVSEVVRDLKARIK